MQSVPPILVGSLLFQMDGRAAYDIGQPIKACPYEPQSQEEQRWLAGWRECERLAHILSQRPGRLHEPIRCLPRARLLPGLRLTFDCKKGLPSYT
jgi:hypothetical protein